MGIGRLDARHAATGCAGRTARSCAKCVALVLACTVLGACAGTPAVPPPVDLPSAFSRDGVQPRADRWWESMNDPTLDSLIDEALRENFNLATLWDRLAQARAVARREGAPLLPALDTESGATSTWSDRPDRTTTSGTQHEEDYRVGLDLSWELDLFGRLRAARNAARFDAQASQAEVNASAIVLTGQVASQWYSVVEQVRQLALLDAQIRTNTEVLRLVTMRFRAGQSAAADVLRQRQLVEQRRGERAQVSARAQVAAHALAVLLGRPPVEVVFPDAETMPVPGPLPQTGLPAALLERRPDVRRAYLDILAADSRLYAARADRYPRLSLSAKPGFGAEEIADVVDNWIATLAGNLVAPLFDGGRRRAEIDRTRALVSERIHGYGQVVLIALREVEDALVQEARQRDLIESLEAQSTLARQTLERLRDRYLKGAVNYLDVLDALASQQTLERSLVTARRELLDFRIALHRALAGSFELEPADLAVVEERHEGRNRRESSETTS